MRILPARSINANYCIWCHNQGKDSCSKGLKEKSGEFKKSPFGVVLAGCPLDEKISEMNLVETQGHTVGALAIAIVDNPMCAATGHRICNDCMKACIYQKQEPVDIPQVETRVLKDVLALPFGFEIYSLLTRWNPLNIRRPLPKPATGRKILVVGLGPAGFTLAHHLMNDGHTVVAIDGLKIEPLAADISGVEPTGARVPFRPIRDSAELKEDLGARVMAGFGGVAEYGITVRWDKNFLKLIRLLLERRNEFKMFGGVRFGGTLTIDSAFALGFDHIALCAGAGRPTIVPMKNGLAPGIRQASDFLMALQLTGAGKTDSVANLQVRLPVVVIGGGLTAIDTATEALAYYPLQVEKFLSRHEALVADRGEAAVHAGWSAQEAEVAAEFLDHARKVRAEREIAKREGRAPNFIELLRGWGGATIVYRRRLVDAPSYTLNHEEVAKALEEGINFAERLTPEEALLDQYGCVRALRVASLAEADINPGAPPRDLVLPARTILVAAGTQPNTVLGREDPAHVLIDGKYFQAFDESGQKVAPERVTKPSAAQVLMSVAPDGRAISFFGDLHPSFAGNVVKAMASAKQGYPVVSRTLARQRPSDISADALLARLDDELRATVHAVNRLTPTIVEVVVRAPMAARAFEPGQFYRLQNFETLSPHADGTRLAMEGLALTGASVDREQGLLSTIVLEMGGSSDLCALLEPGEPVILMGPTGQATETPAGETVLLIGGGLGNAVLFSIGQALRANGSRVIYFAGYKRAIDRYKVEEIERAADAIVWCCDEAPGFRRHASRRRRVRRQYRGGDRCLRRRPAWTAADPAWRSRPRDRHRFRRHDGGGCARASRHSRAAPQARPHGDCFDQLADAVHDERDLRAMSAGASRSGNGRRERGVLLLQSGSGPRPRGLRQSARPARPERRAGKGHAPVDRPLAARTRIASDRRGVTALTVVLADAADYHPLKGGGRFAKQTGWESIQLDSLSQSPAVGRNKRSALRRTGSDIWRGPPVGAASGCQPIR